MNAKYALFLSLYGTASFTTQQKPSVFIHQKKIQAPAGTHVKLHNYTPRTIDVTYTPQQVVTIKNDLTALPLSRHTYSTGIGQYIKCIFTPEHPQAEADRKTIELLDRKEPFGNTMVQLLNKELSIKSREAVVRLYRKVTPETNSLLTTSAWKPILTFPESQNTDKLLKGLKVAPDGKIHLENT